MMKATVRDVQMQKQNVSNHVEDFSDWTLGALVVVPPETLEYADLVGLVIELQTRLKKYCNRQKTPHECWTEK